MNYITKGPSRQLRKLRRDEGGTHRPHAVHGVHDAHLGRGVPRQAGDEGVRSRVLSVGR